MGISSPSGRLWTVPGLLDNPVKREWLVEGVIPTGALITLFGETGTGKSFVALDLALSISTGIDWFGRKVAHAPAIYICAEGFSGFGTRIRAWLQHKGVHRDTPLLGVWDTQIDFVEDGVECLLAEVNKPPALVVVDTLDACFGEGDESHIADMRRFVATCRFLIQRFDCAVLVVTHPGHGTGTRHRERGASNLKAAADFRYELTRTKQALRLSQVKNKDGALMSPLGFQLDPVLLDSGSSGRETSCVPVRGHRLESTRTLARSLSDGPRRVLDALKELSAQLPDGDGVHLADWREASIQQLQRARPSTTTASHRKAFDRAKRTLVEEGIVQAVGSEQFRILQRDHSCQDTDTP